VQAIHNKPPLYPIHSKILVVCCFSAFLQEAIMTFEQKILFDSVRTVSEAAVSFADEERCRAILEAMVWPSGPVCPECGSLHSYTLADRAMGRKARPGLRQCAERGTCCLEWL
jgi:hypothetical protein